MPHDVASAQYQPAIYLQLASWHKHTHTHAGFNPLTPNVHYSDRTALLTSRCCIIKMYSTNIHIEYFKHAA
jgi:hypothetical protein